VNTLRFTKMHGLGNDFVIINAIDQKIPERAEIFKQIANRHTGIGCDQVLLVEKAESNDCDFRYRIFNADGAEVEQCGNGARCFARFVREKSLTTKDRIKVETLAGIIELHIEADEQVTVDMGTAIFDPADIPFIAENTANSYALESDGGSYDVSVVSMGNPHVVLRVDDVNTAPVTSLGPELEHHQRFPERVNVGFMQIVDPQNIRLRVWERGSGETLACGTGACAAVVAGCRRGWLEPPVVVHVALGNLIINWPAIDKPVFMTGPAETVFEGTIQL